MAGLKANDTACQMYGYSHKEWLNVSAFDLVEEDNHALLEKYMEEQPERLTVELLSRRKDGTCFTADIRTTLTRFNNKELVIVYIRDMTERRRIEQEKILFSIRLVKLFLTDILI